MTRTRENRSGMLEEISHIFNPRSIAIIGASRDPRKLGNRILRNLIDRGFKGKLFPVNPEAPEIDGLSSYPSVLSIPEPVDLAVIVLPASLVIKTMEECIAKKISGAVVISSGFAEAGPEGRKLQNRMTKIARKGGLRFVGPNCEGIFNATSKLDLTFAAKSPKKGTISFISQSGAIGANTMFRWGAERSVGFNIFCSSGNEADLCSTDYLEYLGQNEETKVVMIYVEGIRKGRKFFRVAKRTSKSKPIVIMKGGITEAGSRAVSSHTGVLAGSDTIFSSVCKQAGLIRVNDADELFDIAMAFDTQPLPRANRVGVITGAGGGMGVIAVDACVGSGLDIPSYSSSTQEKLKSILPSYAPVGNPVDLTPIFDPMRLVECTEAVLRDDRIDSVISMGFGWRTDLISVELTAVEEFLKLKKHSKPIFVVSVSSKFEFETLRKLEAGGFPVFLTPGRAAKAIAALVSYKSHIEKTQKD